MRSGGANRMKLNEEQQQKRDRILKWTAIVLCLILPGTVAGMLVSHNVTSIFTDLVLHVTWCGFYGCLLLCRQKVHAALKVCMILINVAAFAFPAIGLMMAGLSGLFVLLLKTVIPFIPWFTLLG